MKPIKEVILPGIGKKFMLTTRTGDKVVVVVHDDGRREIFHYYYDDPDDSISMVTLDDEESRSMASILGGMAYRPKNLDSAEITLGDMVIEWYKIEPGAYAGGKTIGGLGIRELTGGTVIAIVNKDHQKLINPGSDVPIQELDTLVILGEKEQVNACKRLLFKGNSE